MKCNEVLAQCKRCGGNAVLMGNDDGNYYVQCVDCLVNTTLNPSIEDAVEEWNKED